MKKTLIVVAALLLSNFLSAQCPQLVWSDEFDGTSLDLTKWEPMLGDGCDYGICGWGNNELQYYQAENAVVSGGTLKIIARNERVRRYDYTSARLRSKDLADFTFGRFEARIKLMTGQGFWPAFWMLSTNEPYGGWPQSGEIDIMELLGQEPAKVHGTIHYGQPWPNNSSTGTDFDLHDGTTFADDFHVFAVEWEAAELRWYVDDILYATLTPADIAPQNWPFDAGNPMHFLLNVAVGGNWPGSPDGTTPFPSQMEVDYVRVYDNGFNPSIAGDRLVPNQAQGEMYTINNADGATFDWSVPNGATITSGQGTNTITVDWGDTGGDVTCAVTTACVNQSYTIDVAVEAPYVRSFAFENFDDPANVSLTSASGTLVEVSNPDAGGINTSALSGAYTRNAAEQYDVIAYATSAIPDAGEYASAQRKFYMDVRTDAPVGTDIIIQLESAAASPSNYPTGRHSRYVGTVTQNGAWKRIIFELLDRPDAGVADGDVSTIILLFASNSFTGDLYYFDNFDSYTIDGGSGPVNQPPVASFTTSTNALQASFDGSGSSDSDGSVVNWAWDFGDGNTGGGTTTSHTYAASGDYTVTLTVTDNEGATAGTTQTVSVSDGSGGDPTSVHVQAVSTGTQGVGQGQKKGRAVVTIHDDLEQATAGATVTGTFSGTFNETASGVTGNNGQVTLLTSGQAQGNVTVNFCVDNVTHPELPYDAQQNDVTCNNGLVGGGIGTQELTIDNGAPSALNFHPNPARDVLVLTETVDRIVILNATGQVVLQRPSLTTEVSVANLTKGTYFVRLFKGDELVTRLMVKQ